MQNVEYVINVGIPEKVMALNLPSKDTISRKHVVHFFFWKNNLRRYQTLLKIVYSLGMKDFGLLKILVNIKIKI